MRRNAIAGLVIITITAVWLGGCSQEPTDEEYDDVAVAVGALVASDSGGEVGSMSDCVTLSQGQTPVGMTGEGSGAVVGLRAGLEYEYTVTCLDSSDTPLDLCDETTDSARLTVSWTGELDLSALGLYGYSYSVARTGDWTLSGLRSGETELNGQGSFDVGSHYNAIYGMISKDFTLDYDATYTAVRIDDLGVIRGGQITYGVQVHAESGGWVSSAETDLSMQALVTFDSSGQAMLEMDGHRSYDLDLATGSVTLQ